MINVEKTALRAFEQDALVVVGELLEQLRDVRRYRRHDFRVGQRLVKSPRKVNRIGLEVIL